MDRNIAVANDKVTESNNTFNITNISQQAYTQEGQNNFMAARNSVPETAGNYLPAIEFGSEFGGAHSEYPRGGRGYEQCNDSGANNSPLASLPNPMSLLGGGGGDSGSGNSSPLSALNSLFGSGGDSSSQSPLSNLSSLFGGSGDSSSASPLSTIGSLVNNQTADTSCSDNNSSSDSSDSTASTVADVAKVAGVVAAFC